MWPTLQTACVSLARDGWHQNGGPLFWQRSLHGRVVYLELRQRGDLVHPLPWDPHAPAIRQSRAEAPQDYDWDSLCSDLTPEEREELVDLAALPAGQLTVV